MATNQLSSSFIVPALIGAALGFLAAYVILPSNTCPAPTKVEQAKTTDGSVKVQWPKNSKAQAYLVWARDSSLLNTDSVTSSITVTGTEATIPGLQPNHGYLVQVFSICKESNGKFSFSGAPVDIGVRTGWIVIEDVVDFTKPNCPFNNCDTLVTKTDTCFNWGSGDEFYSVEVRKRNANQQPDTLLARFYMEKLTANNTLNVKVHADTPCGAPSSLNQPSKSNCKPQGLRFCGSAAAPGIKPIDYQVNIDFAYCCISGFPKDQYQITVKKCHYVDTATQRK